MERQARERVAINDYFRSGVALINHKAIPGVFQPARELLLSQGAPETTVNTVFTTEGRFKVPSRQPNPDMMSPFALAECITQAVEPIYELVDYSVNMIYPYGFIRHNMPHIERVLARGYGYLLDTVAHNTGFYQDRSAIVDGQKAFVTAALTHDIGNLQGRDDQTGLSIAIMHNIFPQLEESLAFLKKVEEIIQSHSNSGLEKTITSWGATSADDIINRLHKEYSPELLALFLADKVDRGRQRIHPKSATTEAFDANEHIALNFFGSTKQADFSEDGKQFQWNIAVSNRLSESDRIAFPAISPDGTHAYIPNSWQKDMQETNKTFFEEFQDKLWHTSSGKLLQTVMVAFALSPAMQEFQLSFIPSSFEEMPHQFVFTRGKVEKTIDEIKKKYSL